MPGVKGIRTPGKPGRFDPTEPLHMTMRRRPAKGETDNSTPSVTSSFEGQRSASQSRKRKRRSPPDDVEDDTVEVDFPGDSSSRRVSQENSQSDEPINVNVTRAPPSPDETPLQSLLASPAPQHHDEQLDHPRDVRMAGGIDENEAPRGSRRRFAGRKRATHPIASVEAAMRRQLQLRTTFRAIGRALKPVLNEQSERTIDGLELNPTYHEEAREYQAVLADLQAALEKRRARIKAQDECSHQLLQRSLDAQVEARKSRYNAQVDDLRQSALDRAEYQLLELARQKQLDDDKAGYETEDEDEVIPLPKGMAYGGKLKGPLAPGYHSRSQLALETQRASDDLQTRFEMGEMLRQYCSELNFDEPSRFTVMDSAHHEAAVAKRESLLRTVTLANAAVEEERISNMPKPQHIPNEEAVGLQILAELASRPALRAVEIPKVPSAAESGEKELPVQPSPQRNAPPSLPPPSQIAHGDPPSKAIQAPPMSAEQTMPPPATPKQRNISSLQSPAANRRQPQHQSSVSSVPSSVSTKPYLAAKPPKTHTPPRRDSFPQFQHSQNHQQQRPPPQRFRSETQETARPDTSHLPPHPEFAKRPKLHHQGSAPGLGLVTPNADWQQPEPHQQHAQMASPQTPGEELTVDALLNPSKGHERYSGPGAPDHRYGHDDARFPRAPRPHSTAPQPPRSSNRPLYSLGAQDAQWQAHNLHYNQPPRPRTKASDEWDMSNKDERKGLSRKRFRERNKGRSVSTVPPTIASPAPTRTPLMPASNVHDRVLPQQHESSLPPRPDFPSTPTVWQARMAHQAQAQPNYPVHPGVLGFFPGPDYGQMQTPQHHQQHRNSYPPPNIWPPPQTPRPLFPVPQTNFMPGSWRGGNDQTNVPVVPHYGPYENTLHRAPNTPNMAFIQPQAMPPFGATPYGTPPTSVGMGPWRTWTPGDPSSRGRR